MKKRWNKANAKRAGEATAKRMEDFFWEYEVYGNEKAYEEYVKPILRVALRIKNELDYIVEGRVS